MNKKLVTLVLSGLVSASFFTFNKSEAIIRNKAYDYNISKSIDRYSYQYEIGDVCMYIQNEFEKSKDGNVVTIYKDKDMNSTQIKLNTKYFKSYKPSYIYIDGILVDKERLGNSQINIFLQDEALRKGKHTVEVVQYEDDMETGNITIFKTASYYVKTN